jgi:hypothetical protein
MTAYTGVTNSNAVPYSSKTDILELFEEFHDEVGVSPTLENGQLTVANRSTSAWFDCDLDEFFNRLGTHIEETLVIRAVGHEGMRGIPDAGQWVVNPDGSWEHERLSSPHRE